MATTASEFLFSRLSREGCCPINAFISVNWVKLRFISRCSPPEPLHVHVHADTFVRLPYCGFTFSSSTNCRFGLSFQPSRAIRAWVEILSLSSLALFLFLRNESKMSKKGSCWRYRAMQRAAPILRQLWILQWFLEIKLKLGKRKFLYSFVCIKFSSDQSLNKPNYLRNNL